MVRRLAWADIGKSKQAAQIAVVTFFVIEKFFAMLLTPLSFEF